MSTTLEAPPIDAALYHLRRAEAKFKAARETEGAIYFERLVILEAETESLAERAAELVREQRKS